jgi:hypothetical protein
MVGKIENSHGQMRRPEKKWIIGTVFLLAKLFLLLVWLGQKARPLGDEILCYLRDKKCFSAK